MKRAVPDPVAATSDLPEVSAGNPCPFLRGLVAAGRLDDHEEPLSRLTQVVAQASAGPGEARLPALAIGAIALVANGLSPLSLAQRLLGGVRLDALRRGPLDKQGAGSRILDAQAEVDLAELARLGDFASPKTDAQGRIELGLDAAQLRTMMDVNFARAAGKRRLIDRALMDGEWPVLLRVMGKPSGTGRYLSLDEVRELFMARRLPERVMHRLQPVGD
jgi:hypothetical protein